MSNTGQEAVALSSQAGSTRRAPHLTWGGVAGREGKKEGPKKDAKKGQELLRERGGVQLGKDEGAIREECNSLPLENLKGGEVRFSSLLP